MADISAGGRIDGPLGFTDFGNGLAVGDFNGDGVADLAISYRISGSGRADSTAVVQIIYGGDGVFDGENASGDLPGGTVTTSGLTDIAVGINMPGPLEFADFNGDGAADLLIGAPRAQSSAPGTGGAAFALFGAEATDPFDLSLADLTDGVTGAGFTATGGLNTGSVFTNLGDFDGDGADEFFIGAPFSPSPGGASLSGLGFVFTPNGEASTDFAAAPAGLETTLFGDERTFLAENAAGVGDVNGDGIADFIVSGRGAEGAGTGSLSVNSGEAYLIFGVDGGLGSSLDVSALDGTDGVTIIGSDTFTVNGRVKSAGDVNGDGFDDLLLQDDGATTDAPVFYLVYGTDDDFGATFDISTAPASRVSTFGGVASASLADGLDMGGVGDVNGDGFDDILLSRAEGGPLGAGEAALLFGSAAGFGASVDLDDLEDSVGYRIQGTDYTQGAGYTIAGSGDLNGDGINDLVIAAPTFNPASNSDYTFDAPGAVFVIYGGAEALEALDQQSGDDGVISLGDVTGDVTIPDGAPAIYSLGADQTVSEVDGSFGVTVTRSSGAGAAEINLTVSGATSDVTRIGGTNTFADGETTKLITFRIEQDTLAEPAETVDFVLTIVSSDQPGELGDAAQRVTIIDDDDPVEYSLGADQEVSEADATFGVLVTRSSSEGAAEIDLSFTGSATSGGANPDFTRIGGTNTFADGETQKLITFRIEQDELREPDETIFFNLSVISANQSTILGDPFQTVTILDNDEPTVFSLGADFSVSEAEAADRTFAITITRSSDVGAAEVSLTPTGTADSADFSRIGGSDTFADGETTTSVLYRVEADALAEGDETISFALDVVSSDQPVLFDDATQVVTILDDDEPTIYTLRGDAIVRESDGVFFVTITRDNDEGAAKINLARTGAVMDVERVSGSDTFADGETVKQLGFRIVQDTIPEPNEIVDFELFILSSDRPASLATATQRLTILDDDPVEYSLGADLIRSEGDFGFAIGVTRNSDIGAATFDLDLTGSARTGGANPDFTRLDGVNAFVEGQTQAVITYRIEEDGQLEVDERIFFELSNIASDQLTTIGDATQTVAILDNTVLYSLGSAAVVSEADGTFDLTVTRTSSIGVAEIGLSLSGATSDITRIGGLNTFANGETTKQITFRIEQDALVEPDETVDFTLSLVSSGQPAIVDVSRQRLTILDDDEASFGGGPIRGEVTPDVLRGTQQADVILGGAGADTLRGGGGGDTLNGGAGADNIRGNGGADVIRGGGGADIVRSGGGADVVRAGGGADTVKGGGGADFLNGGGGADLLEGGGGRDVLTGKAGNDTLKGGGGADTFQFRASDRNDTILDFRQGQDMIEIMSGVNRFEALQIEQDGRDVLIGFGAGQVRVVTDNAGAFDESDFIF